MKKFLLTMFLFLLFTSNIYAYESNSFDKVYGYKPSFWSVFTKETGKITYSKNSSTTAHKIQLSGKKMKTGYKLSLLPSQKDAKIVKWTMQFNEFYAIYIDIDTKNGKRILRYTSLDKDIGKKNKYINFGLGVNSRKGKVESVVRDIQEDLNKFEPTNKLTSIISFSVRGSGLISSVHVGKSIVAENRDRVSIDGTWRIFTKDQGTIKRELGYGNYNTVFSGKGMKTGYALSFPKLDNRFNNVVEWRMTYSENYAIYFLVNTSNGIKYLRYSSLEHDKGIDGRYISFGLGVSSKDGKNHIFRRNLQKDLNKFEPNNKLLSVKAFMIRGSGSVSGISALSEKSITPIENFDTKKFNELLNEKKMISPKAKIVDTDYERVKYVTSLIYVVTGEGNPLNNISFYTLSADQKSLKEILFLERPTGDDRELYMPKDIKFNADKTKIIVNGREYLL